MTDLPAPQRLTGEERLQGIDHPQANVLTYWQWSCSDLLSNATRGIFAEYIVALALGAADGVRDEWGVCDLETSDGIKVEVKASGYVQRWFQEKPSQIVYGIRPTRAWDPKTNEWEDEPRRHADVYVFCLLTPKERDQADPLNIDNWRFYVLARSVLDVRAPAQKTIGLNGVCGLGAAKVGYEGLATAVRAAAKQT